MMVFRAESGPAPARQIAIASLQRNAVMRLNNANETRPMSKEE
jgi:hypothetical protein